MRSWLKLPAPLKSDQLNQKASRSKDALFFKEHLYDDGLQAMSDLVGAQCGNAFLVPGMQLRH